MMFPSNGRMFRVSHGYHLYQLHRSVPLHRPHLEEDALQVAILVFRRAGGAGRLRGRHDIWNSDETNYDWMPRVPCLYQTSGNHTRAV